MYTQPSIKNMFFSTLSNKAISTVATEFITPQVPPTGTPMFSSYFIISSSSLSRKPQTVSTLNPLGWCRFSEAFSVGRSLDRGSPVSGMGLPIPSTLSEFLFPTNFIGHLAISLRIMNFKRGFLKRGLGSNLPKLSNCEFYGMLHRPSQLSLHAQRLFHRRLKVYHNPF